jgi:hypothetical protein
MPPNFGVDNLLLQNLLEFDIFSLIRMIAKYLHVTDVIIHHL